MALGWRPTSARVTVLIVNSFLGMLCIIKYPLFAFSSCSFSGPRLSTKSYRHNTKSVFINLLVTLSPVGILNTIWQTFGSLSLGSAGNVSLFLWASLSIYIFTCFYLSTSASFFYYSSLFFYACSSSAYRFFLSMSLASSSSLFY